MSGHGEPDPPDPADRWRRALEEPFAVARATAGELGDEGWAPTDPTGAHVFAQLVAAPPAADLLDAVRREVPVAARVSDELPAGPAAVAPDGRHVAVLAADERMEVWDHGRGRVLWSREFPGLRRGGRLAARDARSVVVAGGRGPSVELVALSPNDTVPVGALEGTLVGLGVWEPDRVVSVADDATVTVWSLADGPARRMAAPGATPVEDAVVEPEAERVVLRHRGGTRQVLDLATGAVAEAAPGDDGVTPVGTAIRLAVDPAGRLRASAAPRPRRGGSPAPRAADSGELGSVACAVGSSTRLVAAPGEALVVVSDADARVPTTVWTAWGATLHEALGRPLLDATPGQLAVLDGAGARDLSDGALRCLALFRGVLALRLRDAVEVVVEAGAGTRPGGEVSGPGPRDVEVEEVRSDTEPDPEAPLPAYLSAVRTARWWG